MKTLKFQLVFPLVAFLFAIGLAFATEKTALEDTMVEQGYIHSLQPCKKAITCSPFPGTQCSYMGSLVFGLDGSTGCNRPLNYN